MYDVPNPNPYPAYKGENPNTDVPDLTPRPASETAIEGLSGSSDIMVRVAFLDPADWGLKVRPIVPLIPGRMVGVVLPRGCGPPLTSRTKSFWLESVIPDMVRTASPLFEIWIATGLELFPTVLFSKEWLFGETAMTGRGILLVYRRSWSTMSQ